MSENTLSIAKEYVQRGLNVVPVPLGAKAPSFKDWNNASTPAEENLKRFGDAPANIMVLLGPASGNLIDVDLDCDEAVKAADILLPPTGWVHGTEARPRSHRFYIGSDPGMITRQYKDGEGQVIAEIRGRARTGTALGTVIPPSIHPDGCEYRFDSKGAPAKIDSTSLNKIVERLAAAAEIARLWPAQGSRNEAALSLAGALLQDGWSDEEARQFLRAVVAAAKTEDGQEVEQRVSVVQSTRQAMKAGTNVTGFRRLTELLGLGHASAVAKRIGERLGLKPAKTGPEDSSPSDTIADLVLADPSCKLYRDPTGRTYVVLRQDGVLRTLPVGAMLQDHLMARYRAQYGRSATSSAVKTAMDNINAQAHVRGTLSEVPYRVGAHNGNVYVDLGNPSWEVVEISASGWRLLSESPTPFRRTNGMKELPRPERGGSLDLLREFIDPTNQNGVFSLTIGWLVAALSPTGPKPILALEGSQGAAKTSRARICLDLIDPRSAALRPAPKSERDLAIALFNGYLLAFDNLSFLSQDVSDAFCRISTGGGFATRRLFTDDEEQLFEGIRPLIFTGIEEIASFRQDLLDRCIVLDLKEIPESQRKDEAGLRERFERVRPRILGALYDAVSAALRGHRNVKLERAPRMADFARWVVAATTALPFEAGEFLKLYEENRMEGVLSSIDNDLVSNQLRDFMENQGTHSRPVWTGTSQDLLTVLSNRLDPAQKNSGAWPKTPQVLSNRLRRARSPLEKVGVKIEFTRSAGRSRQRLVTVRFQASPAAPGGAFADASDASDASEPPCESPWEGMNAPPRGHGLGDEGRNRPV